MPFSVLFVNNSVRSVILSLPQKNLYRITTTQGENMILGKKESQVGPSRDQGFVGPHLEKFRHLQIADPRVGGA